VGREEVRKDAPKETPKDTPKDTPKNGTPANHVSVNLASANLASANVNVEEQIRRRAYELYLQRRATAGGTSGDQNQDWLIAEREIRSNHGDRGQFAAAAGRA
jgi:hypothetical protein